MKPTNDFEDGFRKGQMDMFKEIQHKLDLANPKTDMTSYGWIVLILEEIKKRFIPPQS